MTSCFVARISNPGERFGKPFYFSNPGERFGKPFYEVDVPCTLSGTRRRQTQTPLPWSWGGTVSGTSDFLLCCPGHQRGEVRQNAMIAT